ncbi:UPF0193 protein EVG1 like [Pseudolycoriella hygida]|uniref:UPF0193 protein EVG1 like n=1 Tax=Pseudolycoriella hygida TaxID=35572 RepID=A0A9Q0MPL8_9DIPT|nr:UPF0193 protein EVG1 like [Pseudolycoriella hygida]
MIKKADWPSDRVPQGGMFHPAKVSYSKSTHDLVKLLMDEQKMTILQRDKLKYFLRNGDPLPVPKLSPPKLTAQQQYENQLAAQIIMRARSARKRTLEEIKASGAFQQEKVKSIKHLREPCNIQKLRLQEFMSGLKHHPELDSVKIKHSHKLKAKNSYVEYDPLKTLMQEIYERADWLSEMEELGEAKPHRQIIQSQIAERLRMIRELEKKKSNESGKP